MKILHVVGARPNFMKAAPVLAAMKKAGGFRQILVHTGQHYDKAMSDVFFRDLGMPRPDINLDVGSGTHAVQTAEIMKRFEPVLLQAKPDWVFVYGDVNSTVACALVASKLGIRVAHVESGLRSGDHSMPEEINRIVTDHLANLLFVTERSGLENLSREGLDRRTVHFVGNTMIDTLVRLLPKAKERFRKIVTADGHRLTQINSVSGLKSSAVGGSASGEPPSSFILVTLHRPANVDDPEMLRRIMKELAGVTCEMPVLFPVHPRTAKLLGRAEGGNPPRRVNLKPERKRNKKGNLDFMTSDLKSQVSSFVLLPPLGYLDFLALQMRAALVITDSGGIQEETSFLGVPCLTLRANTERPVTITHGTNRLCKVGELCRLAKSVMSKVRSEKKGPSASFRSSIPLWDGHAAERIVQVMRSL